MAEMTVLIGYIDTATGEAALIADGCASNDEGRIYLDEWKTARVNPRIAVGYTGDVSWGNQVLARLFRRRDLQVKGPHIRIVRVLEDEHVERCDFDWESAKSEITTELRELRKVERFPHLTVMMAGVTNDRPKVSVWHRDYNWAAADLNPKTGSSIGRISAGPEGDKPDISVLDNPSVLLEERAKLAIREYANEFPEAVNEYMTIRRASEGFRLEIFPDSPTSN